MSKKTVISASAGSLVLGLIIGAAGHSTTKTAAASAGSPTATVTVTAPGAVVTHTAAAPAAANTTAAPKQAVVYSTSGNGIKKTANFTTGAEWSVTYTFNCASAGGNGNFVLQVDGALGDMLANALSAKGGDTSYEHNAAGTHYLSVNSECDWTLKVVNGG